MRRNAVLDLGLQNVHDRDRQHHKQCQRDPLQRLLELELGLQPMVCVTQLSNGLLKVLKLFVPSHSTEATRSGNVHVPAGTSAGTPVQGHPSFAKAQVKVQVGGDCALESVLLDVAAVGSCVLENCSKILRNCRPINWVQVTFHSSATSWEFVDISLPRPMHMTRNFSRLSVLMVWPCCRTTFTVADAEGASTPVLGRTRNLSGAVVLICNTREKKNIGGIRVMFL